MTTHHGIPVLSVPYVLMDMAGTWPERHLEAAINQADALDLLSPAQLRAALSHLPGHPGVRPLRQLLDARTFRLTDSELERLFLRIVRSIGLSIPETRRYRNSFRVDFVWPELGLVVETDSLRFHRTASQQHRDVLRDQAHVAAGLTAVRFTHFQVRHQPDEVKRRLTQIAEVARSRTAALPG